MACTGRADSTRWGRCSTQRTPTCRISAWSSACSRAGRYNRLARRLRRWSGPRSVVSGIVVVAGTPVQNEVRELVYRVLYRDFGVGEDAEWYHADEGDVLALAYGSEGELLGSARLLAAAGDAERQVRQVAVDPAASGRGIGRSLMHALEAHAASEGASAVWLHARDTAIPFYERLGYECVSETFVSNLTGIPHRTMRKTL
ncbi:MAG: GNAT family N-acetyltransferase [Actinobacteria bacterium]|nr:MAG: GNAT family N-acetyltransferase [Actinomycetota bacterium]